MYHDLLTGPIASAIIHTEDPPGLLCITNSLGLRWWTYSATVVDTLLTVPIVIASPLMH